MKELTVSLKLNPPKSGEGDDVADNDDDEWEETVISVLESAMEAAAKENGGDDKVFPSGSLLFKIRAFIAKVNHNAIQHSGHELTTDS